MEPPGQRQCHGRVRDAGEPVELRPLGVDRGGDRCVRPPPALLYLLHDGPRVLPGSFRHGPYPSFVRVEPHRRAAFEGDRRYAVRVPVELGGPAAVLRLDHDVELGLDGGLDQPGVASGARRADDLQPHGPQVRLQLVEGVPPVVGRHRDPQYVDGAAAGPPLFRHHPFQYRPDGMVVAGSERLRDERLLDGQRPVGAPCIRDEVGDAVSDERGAGRLHEHEEPFRIGLADQRDAVPELVLRPVDVVVLVHESAWEPRHSEEVHPCEPLVVSRLGAGNALGGQEPVVVPASSRAMQHRMPVGEAFHCQERSCETVHGYPFRHILLHPSVPGTLVRSASFLAYSRTQSIPGPGRE